MIYLFERIFNLVSSSKLVELSDTNNKLLQELSSKAPGTFQHSLQVMNMVEAAGRSVHANVPLLRAAALYHDIGKMRNPLCFIENSSLHTGPGYHDGKDPRESARDIIAHVSDGLQIARENNLPEQVRDFIDARGYAGRFGHGLGHSVGIDIHENPRLSTLCHDTVRVGHVLTVEPGIYLPGKFGVRIEDLVMVTDTGVLVGQLASQMDAQLGVIAMRQRRQ